MFLNRKGMSMAIEIFIVLFVLLAVAMLVLRLVTEQSEQQIKIINEELRQQQLKKIKADCQSACKCDSMWEKVGYCLTPIKKGQADEGTMDFSGDGFTKSYAEPPETAGLYGLCEDKVHCSQLTTCKCGDQVLDMKNCFTLICTLWTSQGADVPTLMQKFFPAPTCQMDEAQAQSHWSFVYSQDMACE